MWKSLIRLSEKSDAVIAQLPKGEEVGPTFSIVGVEQALSDLEASAFYYDEEAAAKFVRAAKETKKAAYEGVVIAIRKNAQVTASVTDSDMLASLTIIGPYGGKPLRGADILNALSQVHVIKGINKLALKKALAMGSKLAAGETIEQPVARGLHPANGKDTQFISLVPDINERVLAPQQSDDATNKVDMRDLGETITVEAGEPVLKRIPATKGKPGFTVLGASIPPKPGKDTLLKASKGSEIDNDDPNLLRASQSGMPIIKNNTVEVDPALVIKNVDVSTGHVKFKGSIIISENIEPDMVVRATGSITVGGFIESADVQAQEDITVGKGIIGHAVAEDEDKACVVKTNGSIKSRYAQYAFLQASGNIDLDLHCLNSTVMCIGDLCVKDAAGSHGTLSGGVIRVGGKVECHHLGVEGDTATFVQPFVQFAKYKQGLAELRDRYKLAQDKTMDTVRQEIEFKKKPKGERDESELESILETKENNKVIIENASAKIESAQAELERLLNENTISADKVFTRVTVQYGDEKVITKRERGKSLFFYDQYKIHCKTMVEGVEEDEAL